MRALVTGGAGFIGSNLVDRLIEEGNDVVVVDDFSTGRRENVDSRAELIEGDVREVAPELPSGTTVVFHLAAQVDVRRSVLEPIHDLSVNAGGTIAVLEAARSADARVVFASTGGAIYGEAKRLPTPEEAAARPLSPYGASKLAAEEYCRLYAELHGVRSTVLRLANVYGPRQDPLGEGGVVAIFSARAHSGDPLVVFGEGSQTRDFVYVGDVVDAFVRAAEHEDVGPYNIGSGIETSVNDLAEALIGITGRQLDVRREPARPGEVHRSCLDGARAAEALAWRPRTDLADGLRRTLDWVAAQP